MILGRHLDGDDDDAGEPSDAQIVDAVRGGDIGDFALLWRRHVDSARRAARAISPSSDPDDLVSEAFASILRVTKAGGGPSDAFRPYLLATLRNTAARWSRNGSDLSIDMVSERDLAPEGGDAFERIAERSSIAAVFGTLSARHRTLLWYLEVEGMKPRELAPLMGMTPNAVSALAVRARDGFRRAWLEAHIHDPSRSEDCRWFCERVVERRGRPVIAGDADRFREHMDVCGGCRIVAAEIDTVSQRLRTILPAALLGGAAAAIYTGDASAEAQVTVAGPAAGLDSSGGWADPATSSSSGASLIAAHGAAAVIPAGGVAALAATAVVMVGAVILAGSVLSLSAADAQPSDLTPAISEASIAGEAGAIREDLPEVPPQPAEPAPESQPAPSPKPAPSPEPDLEPEPSPGREPSPGSEAEPESDPEDGHLPGQAERVPPEHPVAPADGDHPEEPGSSVDTAPPTVQPGTPPDGESKTPPAAGLPEFRVTRAIAQNSLVPDLLEGVGVAGAVVTVTDESGIVLDAGLIDDRGRFVLDVSGEATHQGMTLRVSHYLAATGVTRWAEAIGPVTFATPTIAPADEDACPEASRGAVSCLHLRAEPGTWVELLDEQGRSRTVHIPAGDVDGLVIRSGVGDPFVAARYIDPSTGRAGVTALLPAAIE
ncbi:sigma-70 family RNA polymerase sigma factor [Microbacterium sp. NPDC089320]|uniref:RNA polymerase sigma factor n=1 Tax=Microbacterium sp. NPDC089320 TaxID=3155182 RepID=UPI0034132119